MNTIKFSTEYFPVEIEMNLAAINQMEKLTSKYGLDYPTIIGSCVERSIGEFLRVDEQFSSCNQPVATIKVVLDTDVLRHLSIISRAINNDYNVGFRDIIERAVIYYCSEIDKDMENAVMAKETLRKEFERVKEL